MLDKLRTLCENENNEYFWSSINYVMMAGEVDKLYDLAALLNSINTEIRDEIMTMDERLFAQGKEEGGLEVKKKARCYSHLASKLNSFKS